MDERDLSRRRGQMGRSTKPWIELSGPDPVWDVRDGGWLFLTGAPSSAVNQALVHDGEEATLAHIRGRVEQAGFPTAIMRGARRRMGARGVDAVHGFPPARSAPEGRPAGARRGRRRSGYARDLMADAFELEPEIADVCSRVAGLDGGTTRVWLLVDDGQAVSAIITAIAETPCACSPAAVTAPLCSPTSCSPPGTRAHA